jgi:tryptophan 7-halogenase
VHIGQGNIPQGTDPLGDYRDEAQGCDWLKKLRDTMVLGAKQQPTHQQFIDQHCKAAV